MQRILVCAHDFVLAKKIQILLARDEIEVEVLSRPSQLEARLGSTDLSLLILSRELDGEDAIEMLASFDPSLTIPSTIVLGGEGTVTADFIHQVRDPNDRKAIYTLASELLSGPESGTDDELTHIQAERAARERNPTTVEPADKRRSHSAAEEHFGDVTGLDEVASRLERLEAEALSAAVSDAFDIDVASGVHVPETIADRTPAVTVGGLLEPAHFAKALFQSWSTGATGALVVVKDHETLTVHFERGSPVHVESSIPGDPLGRALVTRGRITDAQYADAAKRAVERGVRLGQALVDLGFFSDGEIGQELGNTARDQIVGCFSTRQGAFEFDERRRPPTSDRPYRLEVGRILADGIRKHASPPVLREILGTISARYFKLNKSISVLKSMFPLTERETRLLELEGRAYNVEDASEVAGLALQDAHKLMALLTVCEEVEPYTPSVEQFEDRIREEKQRSRDLEVIVSSQPAPPAPEVRSAALDEGTTPQARAPIHPMGPSPEDEGDEGFDASESFRPIPLPHPFSSPPPEPRPTRPSPSPFTTLGSEPPRHPPPPLAASSPSAPAPPLAAAMRPAPSRPANGEEIPPMPVPLDGSEGMVPRPLMYAKALPRGPDGSALETPERTLSREHFQRGVQLLGQGNFSSAEEAFRDAVALCSEEHVYLIGLARAIYYNPSYGASGKLPLLKSIVTRAELLAPKDKRVSSLRAWVSNAETMLG